MSAATVTLLVTELAALVKHADNSLYIYNLPPRYPPGEVYHRCLKIEALYPNGPADPQLRFTLQENMKDVATVTHKMGDLFDLLPRLAAYLDAHDWGPA